MSKNVYYILFNKTFARPAGELIREILSFDKDAFFAVCTYDIDKKSFAQTMKSVQYVEVNLDESLLGSIPVPVKRWPNFIFTK